MSAIQDFRAGRVNRFVGKSDVLFAALGCDGTPCCAISVAALGAVFPIVLELGC